MRSLSNESALTTANLRSTHTVVERAGFVYGWDLRNVRWNRRLQPGIVGEGGKTLKVRGQHHEQHCGRETDTLTALIHSSRSWSESFLHSRRTLGFLHVFLAKAVDTRRPKSRTRTRPRKEPICGGDGEWWRSREGRGCACSRFINVATTSRHQKSLVGGTNRRETGTGRIGKSSRFNDQGRPWATDNR
jgi:hypothetical protein